MSSADLDEFLARVDEVTAPTCGGCGATLDPDGPSAYYCDDDCSDRWHATQSEPLVGYREPWWRPADFPGIGQDSYSTQPETASAGWVLPLADDGLISYDLDSLTSRWGFSTRIRSGRLPTPGPARVYVSTTPDGPLTEMWTEVGHAEPGFRGGRRPALSWTDEPSTLYSYIRLHTSDPAQPAPAPEVGGRYARRSITWSAPEVSAESVQDRALRLRRERNTGPQRQERPPRRLGMGGAR